MYQPPAANPHQRRRKKRYTHGMRTVEVARGKSGYGFTISGQSPCILSCIVAGSPADLGGLKTGDFLLSVNGQNVSRSCHDEVVRLIGSSQGVLLLQIAENINNSSDSSEDESQARPKNKYPNRSRHRGQAGGRIQDRPGSHDVAAPNVYPRDRYAAADGANRKYQQSRTQSNREIIHDYNGRPKLHHHNSSPGRTGRHHGVENINPQSLPPQLPSRSSQGQYDRQVTSKDGIIRYRSPSRTKHTIITREARLGVKQNENGGGYPQQRPQPGNPLVQMDNQQPQHGGRRRPTAMLVDEDVPNIIVPDTMQVVIGYAGSIDMPRHSKLQTVRGAVRRLRVEQRIHTLVLMEVSRAAVKLVNSMCCTVAHYAPDQVAFSGICPEDNRFFGVITLRQPQEHQAAAAGRDDGGSSCHVFMVDPELCPHAVHVQHAQGFNLQCHPDPTNSSYCAEFPSCATPIVRTVSLLLRTAASARYETEMAQIGAFVPVSVAPPAHQRRESNSSNSDSGLSFGRDDNQQSRVCVVELHDNAQPTAAAAVGNHDNHIPHNDQSVSSASSSFLSSSNYSTEGTLTPKNNASKDQTSASVARASTLPTSASMPHVSASTSTSMPPLAPDANPIHPSGQSSTMERLKVRAMPDPKGFQRSNTAPNTKTADVDLDVQNSADNLRHSYRKIMQTRQKPAEVAAPETPVGQQVMGGRGSAFATPISAPDDTDSLKMPPPALPPRNSPEIMTSSNQSERSRLPSVPSYPPPPLPCFTPSSASLPASHPHSSTKPPLPERRPIPRRTPRTPQRTPSSNSFRSKSTPPIRNSLDATVPLPGEDDYDSDPGTIGSHAGSLSRQTPQKGNSEKIDKLSLVVAGADLAPSGGSASGATCVSALTQHGLLVARPEEATVSNEGRAAGWAVSFDRLLRDDAGLASLTEFLKKEYSEENIVFWMKCEKYRHCRDVEQRKKLGEDIFTTHLSNSATEPINVDSHVRKATQDDLPNASPSLFDGTQKQIWLLMKQDSYPRFLKSELYKQCVMAEMEGLPLPVPGSDATKPEKNNNQIPSTKKSMKKVRSASGTDEGGEEKRRKSLLPWNRNKSDKKMTKAVTEGSMRKGSLSNGSVFTDPPQKDHETSPTVKSIDASLKVIMPDGTSVSVRLCRAGQCVREVLTSVCEERSLQLSTLIPVMESNKNMLIALDADATTVGAVLLLPSTVLRLDLPGASKGRGTVGLRVQQGLSLKEAISPALSRYGFSMDDNVVLHVLGTGVVLDEEAQADDYNYKHIVAQNLDDFKEWGGSGSVRGGNSVNKRPPLPRSNSITFSSTSTEQSTASHGSLTELFRDLGDGVTHDNIQFDEQGIWDPEKKGRNEENRNSGIFSFIRRNSVGEKDERGTKLKSKSRAMFASTSSQGSASKVSLKSSTSKSRLNSTSKAPSTEQPASTEKPVNHDKNSGPAKTVSVKTSSVQKGSIANKVPASSQQPDPPISTASQPQVSGTNRIGSQRSRRGLNTEEDRFFDLLSRTSRQMDDQRGLTRQQLELPDFLKIKTPPNNSSSAKSPGSKLHRKDFCNSDSSIFDHVEAEESGSIKAHSKSVDTLDTHEASVKSNGPIESTPRQRLDYNDTSFSQDGIVPSHGAASDLFSHNNSDMHPLGAPNGGLDIPRTSLQQRSKSEGQVQAFIPPLPKPRPAQRKLSPSPRPVTAIQQQQMATLCSSEDDADITLIPPSSSDESEAPSSHFPSPPEAYRNPPVPRARKNKHLASPEKFSEDEGSTDSCPGRPRPNPPPRRQFYHLTHQSDDNSSLADSSLGQHESDIELNPDGLDVSRSTPSPTTHSLILEPELTSPEHHAASQHHNTSHQSFHMLNHHSLVSNSAAAAAADDDDDDDDDDEAEVQISFV